MLLRNCFAQPFRVMAGERMWGTLLVAASAVAYSTAGFYTRLIPLDAWTLLFWRGLFAGGFIAACVWARHRRRTPGVVRAMGWPGLTVTVCSGLATILFINAFRRASVAEVVIILATLPFVTAAIGRVAFGLRESRATLAASILMLLGVGLMVGGPGGHAQLAGEALAFGATVLLAAMMLIVRRHRATPMLPAAAASALLAALLVWPLAAPFAVNAREMGELALFGVTQLGFGLVLLTLGTRLLSATESALIGTLEVPLAALWVWLAFAETPRWSTIAGGAIVIGAVLAFVWRSRSGAVWPITPLLPDGQVSADGTMRGAWASMKSARPKDGGRQAAGAGTQRHARRPR
ncbi:MAG: DMT family transporter [Acetobacteraceae bacterium]